MDDFLRRAQNLITDTMVYIKQSYIHMVSTFSLAALELEFVFACARNFDYGSKTIKDQDGNRTTNLDHHTIDRIFKVTPVTIAMDISKEEALERWEEDKRYCIKYDNNRWLVNKRPNLSRWPKGGVSRSKFKEEINDPITLLNRIAKLKESNTFEPWT